MDTEVLQNLVQQLKDTQANGGCSPETYMCGGTEGWRRVVYLDMTDPTSICPSGWQLTGYSKRTCGRVSSSGNCDSVTFPVSGGQYKELCGRVKAYQFASTDAFYGYNFGKDRSIDGAYIDGVSLTHGSPRQHIWSFTAGLSEFDSRVPYKYACPCDAFGSPRVPSFVGNDFFCESGNNNGPWKRIIYANDPLWDGKNCGSTSSCCNIPSYFTKQLSAPTSDDIEARICLDEDSNNENIAVEIFELYVK